jgi:hypothetical protein
MLDANELERMAKERPDECFLKGSGVLKLTGGIRQLERERDELRGLWLEWLEGLYDGKDLLRRVRLAVHGPLRKPDSDGVSVPPPSASDGPTGVPE